jgi:hypothetical protein
MYIEIYNQNTDYKLIYLYVFPVVPSQVLHNKYRKASMFPKALASVVDSTVFCLDPDPIYQNVRIRKKPNKNFRNFSWNFVARL